VLSKHGLPKKVVVGVELELLSLIFLAFKWPSKEGCCA